MNSAFQPSFPNFIGSTSGFVGRSGGFSLGDDTVDGGFNAPTALPEPSTWIGGIFALAVIAFMQRRRLRGLTANRT
jgi:hypothetical protein